MAKSAVPTSSDVARSAGVSRAVVSVVLNGAHGNVKVAPATRERVLAAAADLGYAPNRAAQALRRRRSGTIGFVPRVARRSHFDDPVAPVLSIELARAATRRGYHLIEASAETAATRESTVLAGFLRQWRVDAVLSDSPETAVEVERLAAVGAPVVQLFRPWPVPGTPSVTVDPAPGLREAVAHLAALGHTRVAFLGPGGPHPVDRARLAAFEAGAAAAGVPVRPGLVVRTPSYHGDAGEAAARALLARDPDSRPTAIVAAGDPLAAGALRAIHALKLWVPEDVGLVSFDDAYAAHLTPPLTSVAQPFADLADRAIDLALSLLAGGEHAVSAGDVVLPTRLVVRSSTARPR
jgi:DNA-binding LacI/PurR family transcriptional regulator